MKKKYYVGHFFKTYTIRKLLNHLHYFICFTGKHQIPPQTILRSYSKFINNSRNDGKLNEYGRDTHFETCTHIHVFGEHIGVSVISQRIVGSK